MLILGKNNDDKGTQLEQFTCDVLKRLGYINVTSNEVRSGAEELDVTGEYHIPVPGSNPQIQRLIAECKATKTPLDISVWHKFLGKIYTEEMKTGKQAYGCIIALSGANGNCLGAYKDFQLNSNRIRLLASDDLLSLLREMYSLAPEKEIAHFVSARTTRTTVLMDVAYYSSSAYWYVRFDDDTFSLVSGDGHALEVALASSIAGMIENAIGGTFIDLNAEDKARREEVQARSFVAGHLLMSTAAVPKAVIAIELGIDDEQVATALRELLEAGLVCDGAQGVTICPDVNRAELIETILTGFIRVEVLSSPGYRALFDTLLADSIAAIQGGLSFTAEQRDKLLFIISVSPSAARTAVTPQQMIVQHRKEQGPPTSEMEELDIEFLFESLFERLEHDFSVGQMSEYFFHEANIVEIDRSIRLVLKSKEKVCLEYDYRSRSRKAEFDKLDERGRHPIITVRCKNDIAEPWEPPFFGGGRAPSEEQRVETSEEVSTQD